MMRRAAAMLFRTASTMLRRAMLRTAAMFRAATMVSRRTMLRPVMPTVEARPTVETASAGRVRRTRAARRRLGVLIIVVAGRLVGLGGDGGRQQGDHAERQQSPGERGGKTDSHQKLSREARNGSSPRRRGRLATQRSVPDKHNTTAAKRSLEVEVPHRAR